MTKIAIKCQLMLQSTKKCQKYPKNNPKLPKTDKSRKNTTTIPQRYPKLHSSRPNQGN